MKKLKIIFTGLICICSVFAAGQKTDKRLQKQIMELVKGFHGVSGVYVYDLKKNKDASWNADTSFPTASIVKIPIMIGIMNKIRLHELDFHQVLTYKDTIHYDPGEDVLASFKPEEKILLSKLLLLSISLSDNTASLMLQGMAGGGFRINQLMDSLGFTHTKVNSRTPGREGDRALYGWGQTTPKEIVEIVKTIVHGQLLSPEISARMLRTLGRQYWDEVALSEIPPDIFVASKNGAVDESRNEVLFVNAPHPYIFGIFTKDNSDMRWEQSNEAWLLTKKISGMLFKYYNPDSRWPGK